MTSDTTEIQDVQQKAQDTASTVVQQVQQLAETNVSSQKQRVSETLDAVAKTLRDSGEGVREQQPQVASVVDQAAQRVEKFSTFIRDRDVNELVTEAENFARREPLIFLGGALAVGFIAARFVKASSPQSGNGQSRNGGSFRARSGDGNGYGYGYSASTGYGTSGVDDTSALNTGLGSATPGWSASEFGTDTGETAYSGAAAYTSMDQADDAIEPAMTEGSFEQGIDTEATQSWEPGDTADR